MRLILEELKASGAKPRVHGNGFLQFDLRPDGTRRLHVWDDLLPRQSVPSSIHDHVFALRSTVICGKLEHIEYDAVPSEGGGFEIYRAKQVGPGNNTELCSSGEFVNLELRRRIVLSPGQTYTFPAWELHDTDHWGTTATIMEKIDAPEGYGRPRVLVRADTLPDNDFDREGFDPDFLWPFVEKALRLAWGGEQTRNAA